MQSITNAERALLEAYSAVHLHLYLGGTEIPAQLGPFVYTAAVGDEAISCGSAMAATAELSVDTAEPPSAQLGWDEIEGMSLGITWDVDGETEHGLFSGTVETVKISGGRAAITARDAMFFAGAGAFAGQSSYQTDADAGTVLGAIASGMGVSLHSGTASLASGVTISGGFSSCRDQLTLAEAAGYVAGILGGNALINRDGDLEVRRYATASFSTEVYEGGGEAENQDYSPAGLTFTRVTVTATVNADGSTSETETTRTFTAGDGELLLENPLADQAAATRALSALGNVISRGGAYSFPMGIQVEPGDILTVQTLAGSFSAAVNSHRLDIDGGVKSTIRAGGAPLSGGSSGRVSRKLEQLAADFARFKNLQADNAEIVSAKIGTLEADSAQIRTLAVSAGDDAGDALARLDIVDGQIESVVTELGEKNHTFSQPKTGEPFNWVTRAGDRIKARSGDLFLAKIPMPPTPGMNITVDELTVGDLWYDTGNGNAVYRWNGTAWVSVQDQKMSEIDQRIDSITLRVIGSDGTVSEVALNDQGQINLLGTVLAQKIMAEEILCTNKFQVNNTVYKLVQDVNGLSLQTADTTMQHGSGSVLPTAQMLINDNGITLNVLDPLGYLKELAVVGERDGSQGGFFFSAQGSSDFSSLSVVPDLGVVISAIGGDLGPLTNAVFSLGSSAKRWATLYANAVDIGGYPAIAKRTKTVSGTTTANGNISLGLDAATYGILSIYRSDASSQCIPYTTAAGNWYARVQSTGASPSAVASATVTLVVDYYAK